VRHPLTLFTLFLIAPLCFADSAEKVDALLQKYCFDCHADGADKGDIDFDVYPNVHELLRDTQLQRRIVDMLEQKKMPPEDKKQLSRRERAFLLEATTKAMNAPGCDKTHDPGPATIHRLNREEYNNTVRDLFGVDLRPADPFPLDDTGYGFDNISDVLTISPLLAEKYLAAAHSVIEQTLVLHRDDGLTVTPIAGNSMKPVKNTRSGPGGAIGMMMPSNGSLEATHSFPVKGEYIIRTTSWATQAGDELAKARLLLNGKAIGAYEVSGTRDQPQTFTERITIEAGKHRIATAFINDFWDPKFPDPKRRDRNLCIERVEIEGPFNAVRPKLPDSHYRVFFCTPSAALSEHDAARAVISRFASRAWRRPLRQGELQRLMRFYQIGREAGDSHEGATALAIEAIMVSPHFLFRVEQPKTGNGSQPLSDYELASRLSYFLWSSMPDEELFELAAAGKLQDTEVLRQQTARLLRDKKADAFIRNFAGQWLLLRNLDIIEPDPKRFPTATAQLRRSMRRETELFFGEVVRQNRPITDFVDGDYTYVDRFLAKHYGIGGVDGEFQRVKAPAGRGGILAHASVLTVTSNPTRTSPVKRGHFVLDQLLGLPPPPPPPDVDELDPQQVDLSKFSLREQMEKHRERPECVACHSRMDPIGFAFEHFDAVGKWRKTDDGKTINTRAKLPDGRDFDGVTGLQKLLREEDMDLARTVTQKLMTYALGRGTDWYDNCTVNDICQAAAKDDLRLATIIIGIVTSDTFRRQRAK
jgi:hypothetical protein